MGQFPPLEVKTWGPYACFTRPEMKVERVSYEVMTPSAARGLLEAIFWKPEFEWRIREIEVLEPVDRMSIVRNEVKSKASHRTARTWASADGREGYRASEDRTQRHSLILRNVAYVIRADQVLQPHVDDHPAKYRDQFRRRVEKGKCFWRPYLGCREFSAYFGPTDGSEAPIDWSDELGRMLFDLAYDESDASSGQGEPVFFRASIDDGVLHVPNDKYEHIDRMSGER